MSYRITERPGLIKPPGLHPRCCNPLQHASRRTFKRTTDRAELHLTPLVDLLLVLVVFLLQGFSPSGELLCPCKRLQLPEGIHYRDLEAAPIVRITMDTVSLNSQPEAEMSELLRALGPQEPLAKLHDDLVALKNIYRLVHPQPRSGRQRAIFGLHVAICRPGLVLAGSAEQRPAAGWGLAACRGCPAPCPR